MTYRYRIVLIFLLGFFIDCINIFMSAITLPAIAEAMQVSSLSVTWVANSYILGLTLIIPLSPRLAARFGIRELMTASMLLFAAAAVLAGSAESFTSLIFWRFLQGVAGGLLIPAGQSLTFQYFQGRERSKISTIIMMIALIAPALSPMAGGSIVDFAGWRPVFYVNAPVALFTALLAWCWIREPKTTAGEAPDLKGLLLVSLTLASLLIALSLYGEYHNITGALALGGLMLFSAGLYYRHYRQTPQAIIDLSLLKNTRLWLSVAVYYAVPGVFTGANILAIFYLTTVLGLSTAVTGAFMLLYAAGAMVAMLISGAVYNRTGAGRLFIISLLLHSGGIALFALTDSHTPLYFIGLIYLLTGTGGIAANCAQTTALYDFHGTQLNKASVIWNINRQVVFSIGTAVMMTLYQTLNAVAPGQAFALTFLGGALAGLIPLIFLVRPQFRTSLKPAEEIIRE
ncbi:MFS transporter [Morganella morganii]|uniref:Major facilitator superfamily n=1 Tax=Morganella morganii subsp. morganii KT TaxID=1124991 RepID=J7U995_MORMO|nr:MFS transporter [Morganella morganii]AGG30441.1 Major facilitator superfamily [Morganella morganii subsp. morganii KT]